MPECVQSALAVSQSTMVVVAGESKYFRDESESVALQLGPCTSSTLESAGVPVVDRDSVLLGRSVEESHIERGIERDQGKIADELEEGPECLLRIAAVAVHSLLRDAGELYDLARQLATGLRQHLKSFVFRLADGEADRAELDDLVRVRAEAGGLQIKDHELLRQ